jgi:hypothetical protein
MPKNPDDLLEEEDGGDDGPKGSAVAEVAVKGKGSSVREALKRAGLKSEAKGMQQKFQELLRNPRNKIAAKRIAPKTWSQGEKKYDCEDVVELPPPMTLDEVAQHLKENYGGKKWNVRVFDEDGEVLDAKNIDVPGNPIINADAMEQFNVPSVEDLSFDEDEGREDMRSPIDREIESKQKEGKALELEEMNARLRARIAQLEGKGNGQHKEPSEETTKKSIEAALASQQAKHDTEMKEFRAAQDKESMERRMTDGFNRQMSDLRELITKKPDDAGGAIRDVLSRIDTLKLEFSGQLKDTLNSYKDSTSQQINSLEKHFTSQVAALQQAVTAQANHRPENPIRDVIPLLTSSIEKSTKGYQDIMAPLMTAILTKSEVEAAPSNPVKDTIELLQLTGAIPGPNSQPKDFGNRVVDFAEKMAPDVLNFIEKERTRGAELTKEAVQNQLKLIAQKISNDVSQHASQTIRQIAAQRGLPAPQPQPQPQPQPAQVQQVQQVQPVQQVQQPAPVQQVAASPVGQVTPEEQARYAQRHISERHEEAEEESEGEEELSPEEEMAARVNDTLAVLDREMVVRPKKITWTRFAWDNLPGDVLDKVVFANDDMDVYEAVKPYADEELTNRVWGRIKAKPDAKEFIVAGINQIKAWAVQIEEQKKQAAALLQQAQQGGQQPHPQQAQG